MASRLNGVKGLDEAMDSRPCLIVGYANSAFAVRWGRFFRRQGWSVHLTPTAAEARRLANELSPDAVVIDVEMPDETGWLTAAKLTQECPTLKVVLVGARAARREDLRDVGASRWLSRDEEPEVALAAISTRRLVAV